MGLSAGAPVSTRGAVGVIHSELVLTYLKLVLESARLTSSMISIGAFDQSYIDVPSGCPEINNGRVQGSRVSIHPVHT
ncbi:protein of unknown function [Bradyrhizobium vignae]|uniref:Uncharacterized protein n=1 Tax=Bradyrhizobium vignae TaxID=1549949 RepID=A0A2U3Q9F5_9BRAD|nr:protein of unknown function [Bradyrhizobium vignae]